MSPITERELMLAYSQSGFTPAGKVAAEILGWPRPCPCRMLGPTIGALEAAIDFEAGRRRRRQP